jgi:hypothetical protein
MWVGHPALGQADAGALETALKGKPLGLRSYPADPVVRYTWFDGKLVAGPMELHGIRAFFADTVRVKGGKVTVEGQSSTLVKNEGKLAPMGRTPMRLEIDLQGADAATVLPQLQAALFFPSIKAALDGLPEWVADLLPFAADGKFHSACECTHIFEDGKWVKVPEKDPKLISPAFTKTAANPGLDQKAIDQKLSGTITLIYSVSALGRVDEVWLAKPLGVDLDQMAGKMVQENAFRPGMYEGKPVGTVVLQTISVN